MADKQLARSTDVDLNAFPDEDPLSELARIVGYDNRPALQQLQELERHREAVRYDPIVDLEERTFRFFWDTTDARTGLAPDRWPTPSFASIAAIGFALTAYPIGVANGWVTRQAARDRTLATLRFLWRLPQGPAATGVAGHKGFFYHFLDMKAGLRFAKCELSTIDTALLIAGVLFAGAWFDRRDPVETEIRSLADRL